MKFQIFAAALSSTHALSYNDMFSCISSVMKMKELYTQPACASNGQTFAEEWQMKYFNCQNPKNQVYLEHLGPCESWFSSTKYEECNKPCFGSNRPVCGSDLSVYSNQCELDKMNCMDEVGCKVKRRSNGRCRRVNKKTRKMYYCNQA